MKKGKVAQEPLVWILILNFNKWQDTIDCIDSLKGIEYHNYRILVIENGSTNDSFDILSEKLKGVEIVRIKKNAGYTGGINFGLEILLKRQSDYILLLNNDTLVEKDFLSILVNEIEKNKNAAAACSTILTEHNRKEIWYASGKIIKWRGLAVHVDKGKEFNSNFYQPAIRTEFITGCLMLLKTKYLSDIGLENDKIFLYLDDIEYSIRIRKKGYELLYVPKSIIYHKVLGEKENTYKLYYSVRNRLLLISIAFEGLSKLIAYLYYIIVILYKLSLWRLTNKAFYKAAKMGLTDYLKKNFYKGNGDMFTYR